MNRSKHRLTSTPPQMPSPIMPYRPHVSGLAMPSARDVMPMKIWMQPMIITVMAAYDS